MLSFKIGWNLSCYQLKIDCHRYRLLYWRLMVTTKQKSIVNTQKIKERNINIPLKKSSNHKGREQEKKGTERNYKNRQKIVNKIEIRTYISIFTLNVNGLNSPIKRDRVAE